MTDPIPAGFHSVTPHLTIDGAAAAIEFYQKAFGAEELARMPMPGDAEGRLMHAMIRIGDSIVMLNDVFPGCPSGAAGDAPVTLHLYVADADGAMARATEAGAEVVMPLADMFWGDRYGQVRDPFGHRWSIASHLRDLSPEEIEKGAAEAMAAMQAQGA